SGEGFLESSGAGGTKVAVRPDIKSAPLKRTGHHIKAPEAGLIDLTPGRPSGTPFKDGEWRNAWKKALSEQGNTHLPPALGTSALREAVTGHLAVSRGLSVEPEDVIITGGTSDALQLVMAMLRSH